MKTLLFLLLALPASAAHGGLDVYADGGRLHRLEGAAGSGVALTYRRSDDGKIFAATSKDARTWLKRPVAEGGHPRVVEGRVFWAGKNAIGEAELN